MADTGQGLRVKPHILGGRPVPSSASLLSHTVQHQDSFHDSSVAPLAGEPFQICGPLQQLYAMVSSLLHGLLHSLEKKRLKSQTGTKETRSSTDQKRAGELS